MDRMFVEAKAKVNLVPAVLKNINRLSRYSKIGLFTTVQHVHLLNPVKKLLEKNGVKVFLRKSSKRKTEQGIGARYSGQVLGCDATAARKMNVDAFLYIGTGNFHPIAISLQTSKPVFKLNPINEKMKKLSRREKIRFLSLRASKLSKLKSAKKIGILLCVKPGQYKPKLANRLKKKFSNSYVFLVDTVIKDSFLNFSEIDIWINTGCPRLAYDSWPKPVVNADDIFEHKP